LQKNRKKTDKMEIVSTREFRANQRKYLGMAHGGEDVIVKSRSMGCFRLVPVSSADVLTNKTDLTGKICQALREVKMMREGKLKAKTIDELLDEL
jgi:antitoxin (DNA-binding transcriptional repressor) of toxin-antitoxin stability system